ncbi:MAG: CDP-diacylglycerol--glycerol-3-phosphate 3-phosphatidyltransferase [Bacilli bacterium]|nr:CDP-diacylglycerol--glycerol-3-phosphate 3-phosphatidyltransferase [Bacilli bacterium]
MEEKEFKYKNLPNVLTIIRILLIPVILIISVIENIGTNFLQNELFMGVTLGNLIIMIIFIIASVTDFFDGKIARKYNLVTDLGKFLDPLADKLLVCCTFIYLIEIGKFNFFGLRWGFVVSIIIAREFAVTGLRLLAASKNGTVMAAKMLGKCKTFIQMITIIVLLLNSFSVEVIGFVFVMLSLILTVVSGIDYFVKSKDVFKQEGEK